MKKIQILFIGKYFAHSRIVYIFVPLNERLLKHF